MSWFRKILGWRAGSPEPASDDRSNVRRSAAEARQGSEDGGEWSDDDFPEVIEMPVEDFIDLHHFTPKEIPDVVASYLEAAGEKGFTEVRLIHGRGKGVQRRRVQSLLSRHPWVFSFRDAPVERGGWGATIALLKKPSSD